MARRIFFSTVVLSFNNLRRIELFPLNEAGCVDDQFFFHDLEFVKIQRTGGRAFDNLSVSIELGPVTGAIEPLLHLIPVDNTTKMRTDRRECQKSALQSLDECLLLAEINDLTYLKIIDLPRDKDLFTLFLFLSWPKEGEGAADRFPDDNDCRPDPSIADQAPT
jgi:hypothetical protein